MVRYLFGVLLLGALTMGCGDPSSQPLDRSFLVVVESSVFEPLKPSLERYAEAMRLSQFRIHVQPWVPGTARELQAFVFDYFDHYGIEGALLIGDLPAAEYEQIGLHGYERFPTDLYLQDRDAIWVDQNDNGIFDYHTELEIELYTSRLIGTPSQLRAYFDRADDYRRVGPLVDVSAFIFIDDDWSGNDTSDVLGLDELFSSVEVVQSTDESTLDTYLAKLTGDGAEFVYQKIHGYHEWIGIDEPDGQSKLSTQNIMDENLKVSFVNMINCFAADFTEDESVAAAYTVGTDYGLAIIGSTKEGHMTDPRTFHAHLAHGMRWGEAYRAWFNEQGKWNDVWYLGVVLMGDPLLTLTGDLPDSGGGRHLEVFDD
ncbi:MAG: hypothetical protein WBM46_06255 [Polyangiales bacterium]